MGRRHAAAALLYVPAPHSAAVAANSRPSMLRVRNVSLKIRIWNRGCLACAVERERPPAGGSVDAAV
jgi:hypothetical protein